MKNKIEMVGDFAGSQGEEIKQALSILLGTRAGECSLDRNFGIDWSFVDLPTPIAEAKLSSELIEKVAEYEGERAEVEKVTFTVEEDGTLIPKVVIGCLI